MNATSLAAVFATGIALGAAGHAAFSGPSVAGAIGSFPATTAVASVPGDATPRAEAPADPTASRANAAIAAPRECRPEQGIDRDCEYL